MQTRIFVDQMGRSIHVPKFPKRIISLVPSQTELLAYLGLNHEVIGITKFCIHPKEWQREKKRIGGTKDLKIEEIIDLKPDLIIGNKEENSECDIKKLSEHVPIWMSDINTFDDAIKMIIEIGKLINCEIESINLQNQIERRFSEINNIGQNKRIIYCIWDNPTMVVGKNTFINSLLEKIGFLNMTNSSRYPLLEDISISNPEVIFLSSEPFPFKENHKHKFEKLYPESKVILVDGEMFSWYGSRMLFAPNYFKNLVGAELHI